MLMRNGYPVAAHDVEAYAASETQESDSFEVVKDLKDLPYDHNLIVVSINRRPQLWLRHGRHLLDTRFRNAALLFWELPVIPKAWLPSLQMLDVALMSSQWVR
jgi:hypothetical protein